MQQQDKESNEAPFVCYIPSAVPRAKRATTRPVKSVTHASAKLTPPLIVVKVLQIMLGCGVELAWRGQEEEKVWMVTRGTSVEGSRCGVQDGQASSSRAAQTNNKPRRTTPTRYLCPEKCNHLVSLAGGGGVHQSTKQR